MNSPGSRAVKLPMPSYPDNTPRNHASRRLLVGLDACYIEIVGVALPQSTQLEG